MPLEEGSGNRVPVTPQAGGPAEPALTPGRSASASDRAQDRGIPASLAASSRFTIHRRLGEGGMGVVYLAHDRERGAEVALKTLQRVDPTGIADLKNEFRSLAGVVHENLVVLHELCCENQKWFFTMEVVDGLTFLDHVRGSAGSDKLARGEGYTVPSRPQPPGPVETALSSVSLVSLAQLSAPGASPLAPQISAVPFYSSSPVSSGASGPMPAPTLAAGAEEVEEELKRRAASPGAGAAMSAGWSLGVQCRPTRLRPSLVQLAKGVAAIHAAGKLHRDLKPTNVLVTPQGRVVILDFGLAVVHDPRRSTPTAGRTISGTPAYMAPEQTMGQPLGPAADWYAVGTMLFEALTGRLPFEGDGYRIISRKRTEEPRRPSEIVHGVPEDLDQLAFDCLRRKPEDRPSGSDILRRLGAVGAAAMPPSSRGFGSSRDNTPFVGREAEMAALEEAFATVRASGQALTVWVGGRSGMGKSALVERFLDSHRHDARVLSGRCYERESVPYKAWDALVDSLAAYLADLPPAQSAALLPPDLEDLGRVFPVLGVLSQAPSDRDHRGGELESRRRAFAALRALFRSVAAEKPLILTIDDLQWGDVDSARLLVALLSPPDPPPFLLLASYRSEEVAESELFRELGALGVAWPPPRARPAASVESLGADGSPLSDTARARLTTTALHGAARLVEVDCLSPEAGARLALALLGHPVPAGALDSASDPGPNAGADGTATAPMSALLLAAAIARESEGSPFFIAELSRHAREQGATASALETLESIRAPGEVGAKTRALGEADTVALAVSDDVLAGTSLERVLKARIERLPDDARRLLERLSLAARPLEQGHLAAAAGLSFGETNAFEVLRGHNLVRTRGSKARDLVEPYHDRVREAAAAALDAEGQKQAHAALGRVLEESGRADSEELVAHFEGAGDLDRAGRYAALAAEKAAHKLAFDRAARLYRRALGWASKTTPAAEKRALRVALGHALANSGRGAEAAASFLEAASSSGGGHAETVPERDVIELRRLAAEQYLVSGHIDDGARVLDQVLASVGVDYPSSPLRAVVALVARLAKLRIVGTGFRERRLENIPRDVLQRIDVCHTAGKGLALVDPVRGLGFFAEALLGALDAGEPARVSMGLAFHAANLCLDGSAGYRRAAPFLEQSRAIAERAKDPYLIGFAHNCTAATLMMRGRWQATVDEAARGNEILRGANGAGWEIECGVVFSEVSLLWMGRFAELSLFSEGHAREALERGDLFGATYARMHTWFTPLTRGDVAGARARMREAIGRWSQGGFHIMHFWSLYGETQYELYEGNARAARKRLEENWKALEGSNILRVQFHRVFMTLLRGSASLAAAANAGMFERRSFLREADKEADRLAGEGTHYADPTAALLRAGIQATRGSRESSLPLLEKAIAGFDEADMALHAACARRRKGQIVGGEAGKALVDGADAVMKREGITLPERWTRIYAPGFD